METGIPPTYNRSNLFLVRLWISPNREIGSDGAKIVWCGKVQRVVNGEAHYFTGLPCLLVLLETLVCNDNQPV